MPATAPRSLLIAAASCIVAAGALGQDQASTGPEPTAPPPARSATDDREAMKSRLERWLADTRQREERITAALKKLAEGGTEDEVRKLVEPSLRPGRPTGTGGNSRPPRDGGQPRSRPGGGAGGGPGGGPGDGRPVEGPDRELVMAFIKKNNPELYTRIEEAFKQNPEAGERVFGRLAPHIREVITERDPEVRELRIAELQAGWQALEAMRNLGEATKRSAPEGELAQLTAKLREALARHFDLQTQLKQQEITSLEQRLARLKEEVSHQSTKRDQLIDERMEQIKRGPRERPGHAPPGAEPPKPPKPQ